ncbi:prepilin-type N-terminal cleavage/methylation domain-containing protein [bacterium]|nr:prepilin-type N-terminal cleavage/methylation domain-containing protein [bacterium]
MKIRNWKKDEGFTLIELLLVILIIAILAVIGISQFTNFAQDSRDAATKANLGILRNAIAKMNGIVRVRCGVIQATFPPLVTLQNNDITFGTATNTGGPCTLAQLSSNSTSASNDKYYVATGIPPNPWSSTQDPTNPPGTSTTASNAVVSCTDTGNPTTRPHSGTNGWCYDTNTGGIWANSAATTGRTPEWQF